MGGHAPSETRCSIPRLLSPTMVDGGHYLPGKEENRISAPLRVDHYGLMVREGFLEEADLS